MKLREKDGERDDADDALAFQLPHVPGHLRSNNILSKTLDW
jgi:hypothetical protein